jgi:geranylgeranyl reductase family protein
MSGPVVDVLVVGCGPAGAAAAGVAAAAGLSVAVLERRRSPGVPVQCAEWIPAPLAAYACAPGVRVQAVEGLASHLPAGRRLYSRVPGLMIDRARFDRALAERAQAAGARILFGSALVGLDPHRRMARVATATGTEDLRFRVLVAADGPHSAVARHLGLPPLPVTPTRQYTLPLERPLADCEIWLSPRHPGGYAWLFPRGGEAHLGVGFAAPAGRLKPALDGLHERLVREGRVGARILRMTGGAIPVGGLRARLLVGTILFAGDAAGLTHPVSGAGIAAAVMSGEAAGAAAAAFLAGDSVALASYAQELREQYGPGLARALIHRHALLRGEGDDEAFLRAWPMLAASTVNPPAREESVCP